MRGFLLTIMIGSSVASLAQDTLRMSLLFVGDIMQHDSQISAAYNPDSLTYDYQPCFEYIRPMLEAPDLTIGNLELTLGGPPYKGYPQFSAPDPLLKTLKEVGFDVLVTANNHCLDRGKKGLERTIDMLDSAGILHTGTFKDTLDWLNNYPLLIESNGFKFSLLNYTYGTNGMPVQPPNVVNRIDTLRVAADIEKARAQHTDAIIAFFHWGTEYQSTPNVFQTSLTDFCFDHGVRFVIGAHPHVLQPMEWRKETDQVVAYSLGNFVSGQRDRYKNGGALLHIDLQKVVTQDSVSVFSVKDVRYSLDYIHRSSDVRRTYRILPVAEFENDTTVVNGKVARQMLLQFRDDSRKLYDKENKNIPELIKDR